MGLPPRGKAKAEAPGCFAGHESSAVFVQQARLDAAVSVDPPIAEKRPAAAHFFLAREIALDHQHFFVLPGFGKLVLSERKAREGRNPQTGEAIQIPAKTTLKFRLSKGMKDTVVPKKG